MTLTDTRPPPDEPPDDPYQNAAPTHPARHPTDRIPPQDNGAEQAVLGAMLISPAAIDDVTTELEPGDFYRPQHETIYLAITALHGRGDPVDMVTVAGELDRSGQLAKVGGAIYLHDLAAQVPVAANAPAYSKLVRDKARARTFVETGTKITQLGYAASPDNLEAYLGTALQTLDDAVMRHGGTAGGRLNSTGLADLAWVGNEGQAPRQPPPSYLHRTDGNAIFYAGLVNGIFGDPEHGKTWVAQCAAAEALRDGGTAAMIDVDHNGPDASAARMLLLGARIEDIADPAKFRYYEPEDAEQLLNAAAELTTRAPDVLIVDSIGELFAMLGVNPNDEVEVTKAMRLVCTRPAIAGSCVITIDHLPKGVDARASGFAIGSIAKKRMIRGSYIRADAKAKPTPGDVGRIVLRIEKDTRGELRRSSGGGYAGTLVLDSTREDWLEWRITRAELPKNDDGSNRYTTLMESVAKYIEAHPACTGRDIKADVPGKDRNIDAALTALVSEGFIRREPGPRRAFFHYSEIPYREAEDDHAHTD